MTLLRTLLVVAAAPSLAFAGSGKDPAAPQTDTASFANAGSLSEYFFGKGNAWDASYDAMQQWKKDYHLPIGISADHWWHIDTGGHLYGNGYGVPGESGTYRYNLSFDPSLKLDKDGFVTEVGIHALGRIRDSGEKLRSFYKDTIWTYEAYAFANTKIGTFKGGQIALDFGIGWDNSWWEGVPYFDGYRFNPAWGFSWENTWKIDDKLSVKTTAQYFIHDDRVSGAIAGADAESSLLGERNTFNARIVPTLKINADTALTLGFSALTREIDKSGPFGDDRQTAWSTDLSLTWKNLTVFSQYTDSYGVISPARYVSGGPSDRQNSVEVGVNYKLGPISAHVNYSKGWDHHPKGHQYIFNPGLTFQLTKNLTLYTEYVKWDVTNSLGAKAKYDDGVELILVWNF